MTDVLDRLRRMASAYYISDTLYLEAAEAALFAGASIEDIEEITPPRLRERVLRRLKDAA